MKHIRTIVVILCLALAFSAGTASLAVADQPLLAGKEQATTTRSLTTAADVADELTITYPVANANPVLLRINWNPSKQFAKSPTALDTNLATIGNYLSLLSEDHYLGQTKIQRALISTLGFDIVYSVNYEDKTVPNLPALSFAAKRITVNGAEKTLVAMVARGSTDDGDRETCRLAKTDGVLKAGKNAYKLLQMFIADQVAGYYGSAPSADDLVLFITGHSLGGAVANQTARMACGTGAGALTTKTQTFTYCFAPLRCDIQTDTPSAFPNIHNFIYTEDLVIKKLSNAKFKLVGAVHTYRYMADDPVYQKTLQAFYGTLADEEDTHALGTYLACIMTKRKYNLGAAEITIPADQCVYEGGLVKPQPTVTINGKVLVPGTDYKVFYQANNSTGTGFLNIVGTGKYVNSLGIAYFDIVPKGTVIKKLKATARGFKISWKKQTFATAGYQIQFARTKKFRDERTITIANTKKHAGKVKKLLPKTKYFVRARTYIISHGRLLASPWSAVSKVTTK